MKLNAILVSAAITLGASVSASPATVAARSSINISELSPARFEVIYSGTKFTSRDGIERQLLLSSARLALAHGQRWFVLLAMPGERPDVHPARPNPGFGVKFGHWQPHWNFHTSRYGWQWWHPEWGADFWTKDVDPKTVDGIEVHAIIDLGQSASPVEDGLQFNADDVVRDLGRQPGVGLQRPTA